MEKTNKFENLTDKERVAIHGHCDRGLTFAEVGKELGVSPKAAQVIVARAMDKLQTAAA